MVDKVRITDVDTKGRKLTVSLQSKERATDKAKSIQARRERIEARRKERTVRRDREAAATADMRSKAIPEDRDRV